MQGSYYALRRSCVEGVARAVIGMLKLLAVLLLAMALVEVAVLMWIWRRRGHQRRHRH